jgi:hypothetical protein
MEVTQLWNRAMSLGLTPEDLEIDNPTEDKRIIKEVNKNNGEHIY